VACPWGTIGTLSVSHSVPRLLHRHSVSRPCGESARRTVRCQVQGVVKVKHYDTGLFPPPNNAFHWRLSMSSSQKSIRTFLFYESLRNATSLCTSKYPNRPPFTSTAAPEVLHPGNVTCFANPSLPGTCTPHDGMTNGCSYSALSTARNCHLSFYSFCSGTAIAMASPVRGHAKKHAAHCIQKPSSADSCSWSRSREQSSLNGAVHTGMRALLFTCMCCFAQAGCHRLWHGTDCRSRLGHTLQLDN
jgi:hypothetical protein